MRFAFGLMDEKGLGILEKILKVEDDDEYWDQDREGIEKCRIETGWALPIALENTYYKLKDSQKYPEKKKLESAFKGLNSGKDFHDGTGRLMDAFKKYPGRFMHEGDFIICYLDKDESKELMEFISYIVKNDMRGFMYSPKPEKAYIPPTEDMFLTYFPDPEGSNFNEEFEKLNAFLTKEQIRKSSIKDKVELVDFEELITNFKNGDFVFGYLD